MASIEDGIQAQLANIQARSNAVIGTASALELQVLNLPEIDDQNITSSLTSMSLSISVSYSITGGILSFTSAGNATTIDGINVFNLNTQVVQNTSDIGDLDTRLTALENAYAIHTHGPGTLSGLANGEPVEISGETDAPS